MKKRVACIPILLVLSILLTLTACGGPPAVSTASRESGPAAAAPDESSTAAPSGTNAAEKSLVVYFSWSGNTQQMAEWIADESGSDIYRVTPKEAYSEEFDGCADRAKNELDNGIRPALDSLMDAQTMAQYGTVYVGFPIWWYDLPMAMTAFLETYDLSGKTILPFFSHNGSGSGASAPDTLTKICTGAEVRTGDALSISGGNVENAETQIRQWVNQLNK